MESVSGSLLVATPVLLDPNFQRTVILMIEHGEEGALGVILNRPTEAPVSEFLPDWEQQLAEPPVVFFGGPVQREVAIGVGAGGKRPETGFVVGDVGFVDLGLSIDVAGAPHPVRVFSGYAGWDGGQLEFEIGVHSWFVLDAAPDDVFTTRPDRLWYEVLARQGGHMAMYASYPLDPSLN